MVENSNTGILEMGEAYSKTGFKDEVLKEKLIEIRPESFILRCDHLEINCKGPSAKDTQILLDGKRLGGVKSITFVADVSEINRVIMEVYPFLFKLND